MTQLDPPDIPEEPSTPPAARNGDGARDEPVAGAEPQPPTPTEPPASTPLARGARRAGFWASVRESLRGSDQDFTKGSLNRAVFLLAVPMVLEMAGESVFAVVDAFFVARLGAEALAAVGLTETVLTLVYSTAVGLAMSTTAMVARRYGEGDRRAAARAGVQAIWVGIAISVVLGIAGVVWAPDILRLMGATPETVAIGTTYTRIMYGSMAVILLLFLNNAIYRGAGDAAMAMRSVWLANGINIVLDPALILGLGPFPELGLTGAAIATATGRGVGVLYQLRGLSRGRRLRIGREDLVVDLDAIRSLLRISVGGVGQLLVSHASYIGLVRILALFGSIVLAGYVLAIRIVLFILLPAWGLSNAAATLVGQSLGARKPDRAERAVWVTGMWNMAFMAVVTIVFLALGAEIIAPFAPDPATREVGTRALRIIGYGFVFYGWGMVLLQAFNGAGDTGTPTRINFVVFWVFQLPAAWLLARTLGFGPDGVFWAITVAYSLEAAVGAWLFRRGRWKEKQV